MSPSTAQREIDTDKIERIAHAVASRSDRSDAHDRISNIEAEMSGIKERLHDGDIEFVKVHHSIGTVSAKMDAVISIGKWVLATVGTLTIAFIGSVAWYVLQGYVKHGGIQ